ncbi:MAG: 3-methyl-2-oxobutanoate hydroxymethyltransferase [Candidatus Tectomicrobia bacterium]|nr:3-methyl-2-oxobutanoate hydroxymethyltransferase [Candidatus Tectomicrobia bacterium]
MESAGRKVTTADILARKRAREPGAGSGGGTRRPIQTPAGGNGKGESSSGLRKIAAITAYDYTFARLVDAAGVDIILVGDSLGMVIMGLPNTVGVTMEDMLHHTKAVSRAHPRALLVADMPFLSYHGSRERALANAGRFLQEAGAEAVKVEGGVDVKDAIRALVRANIPVMGHVGLTPQAVHRFGGFKVQGRGQDAEMVFEDALAVAEAGAFSLVLEGIPSGLAKRITEAVHIPTIGIGAGPHCDGQVLVLQDLLGLYEDFTPKFAKVYAPLGRQVREAVARYVEEVAAGEFPTEAHSYRD